MIEALAVVSGVSWLWLLLVARYRLESGKPPSQPGSREARGMVKASVAMGAFFGGLVGAWFGSLLEGVVLGAGMWALSLTVTPRRAPLKSGEMERPLIEGTDDGSE